jgi:aminopeptidase N
MLLLVMNVNAFSQNPPPVENGVSQKLAQWRAANYSDVRYKLRITLEKGAPLMKGDIEVRVTLTDEGAKNDLVLDWRATQFAGDKDKPYANVMQINDAIDIISTVVNEHLIVPKGALKTGENIIKIQFASPIKTSGAAVTRYVDREDGAEYIYSLFVPSDASTAFPCFDQPDLKARFTLSIKAPGKWKIVSNVEPNEIVDLPVTHSEDYVKNLFTTHFAETKPISTYVFAFAAGDFEKFSDKSKLSALAGSQGTRTNPPANAGGSDIYVRRSQAEKFKQHAAEVFRLNREGVKFLESYFDYKFPFPKYDLVLIPEFPFGGMEHAGATFLREDSIIFPQEPTANNYISRANVIFHEAAHQWFGDTVTMRWFDDLWLKEGFAEFMAYKTLEKVMPEYNAWKVFYERNKQLAYLTDATKGTTPIYQEIPNLSAAKSAYGNIVYRKAPSFLRQAEFYLGTKEFQNAVRSFLKRNEFKNAEWKDLVQAFERSSKKDLTTWAENWVKQRGLNKVRLEYKGSKMFAMTNVGCIVSTYLNGTFQSVPDSDLFWDMKTKVLIRYNATTLKGVETLTAVDDVMLGTSTRTDAYINEPSDVQLIFPNYQDYGYGIFLLDDKSRDYVLQNIQNEKDDFLRTMMWGSLWDSVRETELDPKDYVELAIKNISGEKDEVTIQTILGRVSTAINYYLSDAQAKELVPKLEDLLIGKMQNATTLGQRVTFYRAFLNIASTENARKVLKQILKTSVSSPTVKEGAKTEAAFALTLGLPAPRTKDKFDIITKLAILGDSEAAKLLEELAKTETSDEAKRYAYAAGAGFGAKEVKAKYFDDFLANKEISESWIEAAFGPFNSARHSELTLPYLEKALAELPNLKRSRKIFFVNGWLGAFIGGQRSAEALAVVNKFLEDNPNLDKDLRLKILENADALERAVKIRAKFNN